MSRTHAALLLAVSAAACSHEPDSSVLAARAANVARAEEQIRNASNAAKAQLLPLLASPCPEAASEACQTQKLCRDAYTLHVQAVTLTAAAKQKLADGAQEESAKLLGSAAQKLTVAKSQVEDCTAKAAALRQRFHL